jgi:DNA-binding IclR family transcriptional regulator
MTGRPAGDSKNAVKSFVKMKRVLDCFSRADRSLSLADLAARTGMPKATVRRILVSLQTVGFIEQEARRDHYRLGIGLFELGSLVLANMDLHREAGPFVTRLQQVTGEGVHLCVFNGSTMVLIDRREMEVSPLNTVTTLEEAPTYCTGVGKAFLAFQDAEVVKRVLREGLKRYTASTIVEPTALQEELRRIRECGYAIDNGEHENGVRCVAAPIRNAAGRVFASVSVTSVAERMPDRRLRGLADTVMQTAEQISRQLGWRREDALAGMPPPRKASLRAERRRTA